MKSENLETGNSVARYLITTADERTWKYDRPVLFLGEWCRRYDRREIWMGMDAIVAEPYGLNWEQRDKDHAYVTKIAEELLIELSGLLNGYHETSHSLRYWRIVLGHWLHNYASVIVNRWGTLRQAFQNHEISGTTVLDATSYSLATQDSVSFIWACDDDIWNHVLYSRILRCFPQVNLQTETKPLGNISGFTVRGEPSTSKIQRLKHSALKAVGGTLQLFGRNTDAFIINSYLPKKEEIKLQLRLGQAPQLWRSPRPEPAKPDIHLRKRLTLSASGYEGLEQCARALLLEVLPTCYLEGYETLEQQAKTLAWPDRPKFIFTSNNFDTDEIFKAWAGAKVEQGVPYFTGQHGNNYGTLRHCPSETECLATSDKFITWGWTDGNPKHVPAFIFKTAGRKRPRINEKGGLLLIELCVPHRVHSWDSYFEFQSYQDAQFRFVENLPDNIRRELAVRLHGEYKQHAWSEEQRWNDRSPETRIENGSTDIWTLIANNRLAVHSYDSTGVLETLSLNIPTLCFWREEAHPLRASAQPYYEQLRRAGILFHSPEMAARKISEIWDNVPAWWGSSEVQSARKNFCDRYARVVGRPIECVKNILLANIKDHDLDRDRRTSPEAPESGVSPPSTDLQGCRKRLT